MKNKYMTILGMALAMTFSFTSCSKDDDSDNGDNGGGNGGGNESGITVTTLTADQIEQTSVRLRGRIADASSVSSRGFVWGTASNPTKDDNVITAGSGEGSFNAMLSGLAKGTLFNVRAFAETPSGTVYGNNRAVQTLGDPLVGEFGPGGLIVYVDGSGGGLVAAPENTEWVNVQWGCSGTTTNATGTNIGSGAANTASILAGCSTDEIAAKYCNELDANGFSDWFLPSKDELGRVYINLKDKNLGGFADGFYWSSSEDDANAAVFMDFNNGDMLEGDKSNSFRVRAVRAF